MDDVTVNRQDVLRLLLLFLRENDYIESMRSLEKESGQTTETLDANASFLRDLVMDGQWTTVLQFIEPLESLPDYKYSEKVFAIKRQHFLEVLWSPRPSSGSKSVRIAENEAEERGFDVETALELLEDLDRLAKSRQEYANLCYLLSLPSLASHPAYKRWSVPKARLRLFEMLAEPLDRRSKVGVIPGRLLSLIAKGRLYEKCTSLAEVGRYPDVDLLTDSPEGGLVDVGLPDWLSKLTHKDEYEPQLCRIKEKRFSDDDCDGDDGAGVRHHHQERAWENNMLSLSCANFEIPTANGGGNDALSMSVSFQRPTTPRQQRSLFHRRPSYTVIAPHHDFLKLSPTDEVKELTSAKSSQDDLHVAAREMQEISPSRSPAMESPSHFSREYKKVFSIADVQAIRAVAFSGCGSLFGLGSNSSTLRVCTSHHFNSRSSPVASSPTVLFKRPRYHQGSIYCLEWSPDDTIIATGSNDKMIHLMEFDKFHCMPKSGFISLDFHNGTIRDLTFMKNFLVSAGAGHCKVCISDYQQGKLVSSMGEHSSAVSGLFSAPGTNSVVSASMDKTVKMWDIRDHCVTQSYSLGSAVLSVCLDFRENFLAAGLSGGCVSICDLRMKKVFCNIQPHSQDCRSVQFHPKQSGLLLSGSYDTTVFLTDCSLSRDNLTSVCVAEHNNKVIQCRWHPEGLGFASTSADKTACLWLEA